MTQENKNKIMFGRGTKSLEEFKLVTGYQNMVYFNTDEYEIYVGDNKYGFSKADQALLGDGGIHGVSFDAATSKLIIELNSQNEDKTYKTVSVDLPSATTTAAGLMTSTHVNALAAAAVEIETLTGDGEGSVKKAQADAEAYAKGLVDSVLSEDVDAAGAAIVKISQGEDGKIVAVAGDVEAAHVSVADSGEKFTATTVEGVLAEIAGKLDSLNTSADGVDGKITAAIEALDSDVKDEDNAHVKVAISQVDGKLTSVSITEDNIADKSVVDGLVTSVGTSEDAAASDGSLYARIAALVAEDGAIAGRLDVIEGEGAGSVKKAEADAKAYADGLVADLDANVSSAAGQKLTVNVVEVDGKITEVNVTDNDIASAATLAALKEDVDLFFKDASFAADAKDTLKELQEYITSDVAGAASMAESIAANKTAIEKEVTDRENAIKGLNTPTGGVKGEGTFIDVTVVQEAGIITSVTVDEADIASAAALKSLSDTVGTSSDGKDVATVYGAIAAEADARVNAVNGLSEKMGEPVGATIAQDIADAKQATIDLANGAVADNTEAIALLNNTVETEGSVKHTAKGYADAALNAAKAYTDEALYWYEG